MLIEFLIVAFLLILSVIFGLPDYFIGSIFIVLCAISIVGLILFIDDFRKK